MYDEMPAERLNAVPDMIEDIHVRRSAQMLDEVETRAPDAALVQGGVVLLSERPIDDGDPAGFRPRLVAMASTIARLCVPWRARPRKR